MTIIVFLFIIVSHVPSGVSIFALFFSFLPKKKLYKFRAVTSVRAVQGLGVRLVIQQPSTLQIYFNLKLHVNTSRSRPKGIVGEFELKIKKLEAGSHPALIKGER